MRAFLRAPEIILMTNVKQSRLRSGEVNKSVEIQHPKNPERLLTTGQVAQLTGMSESWLCQGRIGGYGPSFIRFGSGRKGGAIRYR